MAKYPGLFKIGILHGNAGEFGSYYVGGSLDKKQRRKPSRLLNQLIKPKVQKHMRQSKY